MGVQTKLSLNEINAITRHDKILFTTIKATKNGITDSTYIGTCQAGKKYIFKVYEKATLKEVSFEIDLLNRIQSLDVATAITKPNKIRTYEEKPAVLFSYLKGKTPYDIRLEHVQAVAKFLAKFHDFTYELNYSNSYLYSKKDMKDTLNTIMFDKNTFLDIKQKFKSCYSKVEGIRLKTDHIIHGDLFPDNTKFDKDRLRGVFDFSNSSKSDKKIDLSVVILSWCFDRKEELDIRFATTFLESYNFYFDEQITLKKLKPYLLYSALYYALHRYKSNYIDRKKVQYKSHEEFIDKFDHIESL